MEKLLAAIADWPVIVQGALGSALFAFTAVLLQRLFALTKKRLSALSRAQRKAYLVEQQAKYHVILAEGIPDKGAWVSMLLYRASRSLFKALLWLTMGLMVSSVNSLFGVIGYLGCFFYLLSGLSTVAKQDQPAEGIELALEKVEDELKSLENEA